MRKITPILLLILVTGCYREEPIPGIEVLETPDWEEFSHGGSAAPDYDQVFPDDQVKRMDIIIDPDNWDILWNHLENSIGPFGRPGGRPADFIEHPFIPVDIMVDGRQWYKVGLRPKGNSSLMSCWGSGIKKIPFKLDFDEFEDQYTGIQDQRFFGFEQLSLKNAFSDPSCIREKLTVDLFRESGLPSIRSAFYRFFIDTGSGPVYFGMYSLVEDVDDVFLQENFADPGGYLYKPEGPGASFAVGQFNTADFAQHQDGEFSDYSDIINLYEILNSEIRLSQPEEWRQALEAVFDTDIFIKWLACNTTVQNWDAYGVEWHNYYLYNDPGSGKIVWIHWDNNEAFLPGKPNRMAPDFDLESVTEEFPLIRFLMDDPVYWEHYRHEVEYFINKVFYADHVMPIMDQYLDMTETWIVGPEGENPPYTHLLDPQMYARDVLFLHQFTLKRFRDARDFLGL